MGLDQENIPDIYYCEECEPRAVDKKRAVALQRADSEEEGKQKVGHADPGRFDPHLQTGGGQQHPACQADASLNRDDVRMDSAASEDDPNHLWCICQKPFNNRFVDIQS